MKLQAALAASLMYTRGAVPTIGVAWARALEIAEASDDTEYQLRSLWGLWSFHISGGRERTALALAERFHTLAESRSDLNDRLVGERMIGFSQHYVGDQRSAQHHIERMLLHYVPPVGKSHIIRFQTDQRVTARAFLGRILWLRGFPEQAMRATASGVEEARATNHAISLCYALAVSACPIALLAGDLEAGEHYVRMLLEHSTRHVLTLWHAWGVSHQGVLAIRRGDLDTGLRKLRSGFAELGDANSALRLLTFLGEMADALGRAGQIADSLTVADEAIARSEHTEERWLLAELLRVKGELLLLQNAPDSALLAEGQFRHALDWARRQGALAWELRAAMSLARLLGAQDRVHEARALLAPIYDQFTEGFGTADLTAARTLDVQPRVLFVVRRTQGGCRAHHTPHVTHGWIDAWAELQLSSS
jgi:predicted ATPase